MKYLVTAYPPASNGVRVVSTTIFEDNSTDPPALDRARAEAERLAIAGYTEVAVWEFTGAPAVRKVVAWEDA